ncbi:MAG: 30S ribosomal protein S8 [Candidatus Peregrinibacteria bacterium]|nr:30S ribosomal protein S8 [Candidatus Peregrinibacteria bacterium]
MYVTDPIGDLLTRIRNAQKARRGSCKTSLSRLRLELCQLLKREGWIQDVVVSGEAPKQEIEVIFSKERPALTLARVSRPGRRAYSTAADLKPVLRGYGMAILTTSQGLLTDREARRKKVGGEILCTIS